MTRSLFLSLTLIGAAGVAFAKPNFTGQWKMDSAKSDWAQFPAPERFDRKITHTDPNLQMSTTQSGPQGEVTTELKYITDGRETTNTIRGTETKGTAKWDGDALVIESARPTPNGDIKILERWTSVNDGKAIQVDFTVTGGFGEVKMKIHLDKQ